MRVVVALGGNALIQRGQPMTADVQRANVKVAAEGLARVAAKPDLSTDVREIVERALASGA